MLATTFETGATRPEATKNPWSLEMAPLTPGIYLRH